MTILRHASTLIIATTVIAGCASNDDDRPKEEENTSSRAQALTSEVESASQAPTGTLSDGSIGSLLNAFDDWDLCTGNGDLPGGLDFDIDSIDEACVTGDDLSATVDLSCASGGVNTGTVSYDLAIQGETVFVHYAFDDVCVNGVCGDGEGAVKVGYDQNTGTSAVVVAGELTLYFQDQWRELKYGVTLTSGASGSTQDIVLWVDGQSYVVRLASGALGSSVEVQAGNGSWQCSVSGEAGAYTGSCSGEGSISF